MRNSASFPIAGQQKSSGFSCMPANYFNAACAAFESFIHLEQSSSEKLKRWLHPYQLEISSLKLPNATSLKPFGS